MRNLLLTSAAALVMVCGATAVSGQSNPATPSPAAGATASQQKTVYETWPADKKADYDKWPAEYQAYFWSLTPGQQTGWFALSEAQRKQLYEMPPASRAAAWASIEQQLVGAAPPSAAPPAASMATEPNAAAVPPPMDSAAAAAPEQIQANPVGSTQAVDPSPDPATAGSSVAPSMPADPSYQAGPYKGALTAPPADAMNKTYPVCTRTLQDSCRNRGGI